MLMGNRRDSTLMEIPDGAAGTKATLNIMRDIVKQYKTNTDIRRLVESLTRNLPSKDYVGEVKAIHAFVRDNIRYMRDVFDVETLKTPDELLLTQQGDCDDKTILAASMLQAAGHPVRLVAIGGMPNVYEHVYPETRIGERWFSVETTEPVEIGWQPSGVRARMIVHV